MSKYDGDSVYEHKFVCVKRKDILKSLNGGELHQLDTLLEKIRKNVGDKNYLCVNEDEPYADEVWKIIKEHETKEIVAFIGRAGSGKDYQCNLLKEKGFVKLAFADALRDIAFSSFDIPYEFGMQRYEEMKAKEDCIKVVTEDSLHKLNFRQFLEYLGTQGIRKYDNDFWCRALIKTLTDKQYKKVCISDMRFINEYLYVKKFAEENGYGLKLIFCNYRSDRYQDNNNHDSAKLANYFATHGYQDLTELTRNDMCEAEKCLR